jgi:hypothetical protein
MMYLLQAASPITRNGTGHMLVERCSWVVMNPASYSEGSDFESQSGGQLSWLRILWFSFISPDKIRESYFKIGHDCFLPHPLQYIIHNCTNIIYFIIHEAEKALLDKVRSWWHIQSVTYTYLHLDHFRNQHTYFLRLFSSTDWVGIYINTTANIFSHGGQPKICLQTYIENISLK